MGGMDGRGEWTLSGGGEMILAFLGAGAAIEGIRMGAALWADV